MHKINTPTLHGVIWIKFVQYCERNTVKKLARDLMIIYIAMIAIVTVIFPDAMQRFATWFFTFDDLIFIKVFATLLLVFRWQWFWALVPKQWDASTQSRASCEHVCDDFDVNRLIDHIMTT